MSNAPKKMRVLVLGGTGTIGRAVLAALAQAGHKAVSFQRQPAQDALVGDITQPGALAKAISDQRFDALISCLASRTGAPKDAWAIDHDAQVLALEAAVLAGIPHFVLLSAICVQKPKLEFQKAKLAFEDRLRAAPITHTIIRPTAFFKSLSGQVARVASGRPYLTFGDGNLTACKPISDTDLARFIVACLTDPEAQDQTLPIGGPGPAISPAQQREILFRLTGQTPRTRSIPPGLFKLAAQVLGTLGLSQKAEMARIAHYYATESMLVWDEASGRYHADKTPEFGRDRLEDHYKRLLSGDEKADLGDHAMFG